MRYFLALPILLSLTSFTIAAEWSSTSLGKVPGLSHLIVDETTAELLATGAGRTYRLKLAGPPVSVQRTSSLPARPRDIIPHGRVARGRGVVRAAWLAAGTERYDHGVLGDGIEAGAIKARLADGTVLVHHLAKAYVFEDLEPRLVDLESDGQDEILLVRSGRDEGAAVAVYGLRGRALRLIAVSDAIGQAYRWLNPVGAADFDGDGRVEIAVVETPHLGQTLVLYRLDGARLVEVGRRPGFSTHYMGSTILDMAETLDLNGDGIVDFVLPSGSRRRLIGLTFKNGEFKVLAMGPSGPPITTEVVAVDLDGNGRPDLVYGRRGGGVEAIPR